MSTLSGCLLLVWELGHWQTWMVGSDSRDLTMFKFRIPTHSKDTPMFNTRGAYMDAAANYYPVIQILDPLPEPALPATVVDIEEGRVYITEDDLYRFRSGGWAYTLSPHPVSGYEYIRSFKIIDLWPSSRRIKATTNTYAVSCIQEVK